MGKLRHGAALQWETHGVTLMPPSVPQHWDQCRGHTGPRKGLCCLICGHGMSANKGGRSSAVAVPGFWGLRGVGGEHMEYFPLPPPFPVGPICFLRAPAAALPCGAQTGGVSGEKRQSSGIWEDVASDSHQPAPLCVGGGAAGGGQWDLTGGVTSEGTVAPWVPLRGDGPGAEPGGRDVG